MLRVIFGPPLRLRIHSRRLCGTNTPRNADRSEGVRIGWVLLDKRFVCRGETAGTWNGWVAPGGSSGTASACVAPKQQAVGPEGSDSSLFCLEVLSASFFGMGLGHGPASINH